MAQQLINYGTYPDDANADAIRTAFLKVEQNFTDLYNNGVAGVSSVNSGQGVIARRSGSNVFVSANVYQLQVASAANSLVFSLGTTNANVAVYSQGSDVLNINPAENFGVTNVYVSGNMYMQGAPVTAPFVTRLPDSTASFTGNGVGLYGIILRPTKLIGSLNQVQFVSTDDFGKPIIVGSNSFVYQSDTNQLILSEGLNSITSDGTQGTIAVSNTVTSNNFFANNISNTFSLVVRNTSSFLGTALFTQPVTSNGTVTITNITPATEPGTGALVVVGGTSIGANLFVGGNSSLGGNVIVSGAHTVVGTISGGNLVSTGNLTVTGNSVVAGNTSTTGSLNVGAGAFIAGPTSINNTLSIANTLNVGGDSLLSGNANISRNISVTGNSSLVGNVTINGKIIITPNVATTTQVVYANGTTLAGSNNFTWNNNTGVLALIGNNYTSANTAVLQISGGAELSGNLFIGGRANLNNIVTTLITANAANINGNLTVTGNITANGTPNQVLYNNNGNIWGAAGLEYDNFGNVNVENSLNVATDATISGLTTLTDLVVVGDTTLTGQVNAAATGTNAFFITGQANTANIISRNLTSTRVVFTDGNSQLVDSPNLTFLGTLLSIVGDISATGNSSVSGNATVTGNSTVTNNLTVTTGNFRVSTGNAVIATGTLSVEGNIATNSNLGVSGNAGIAGNLIVSGSNGVQVVGNILTSGNIFANANITGNANIIAVGNVTANNANISNNISARSANIATTANIQGATVIGNSLSVVGATTLNDQLTVIGNTNLLTNASVGSNFTVTGNTTLTGNYTAKGNTTQVQYNNGGNMAGAASLLYTVANGYVQMTANAQVGGNLAVTSNILGGNITITGNSSSNNSSVTGNISANNLSIANIAILSIIVAQSSEIAVASPANLSSSLYVASSANIRGQVRVGSNITMEGTNTLTTRTITTGNSNTTGTITGLWSLTGRWEATYADLAENYASDANYAPGTVLEFGGSQEVTIATAETTRLAGVVTSEPAYVLNSNISCEHPVRLALVGRVPVRVTGYVHKGDMLISAGNGVAKASAHPNIGQVIGKALQDFAAVGDNHIGIVEAAISRH